jgi:hypothetical protein
MQAPVLLLLFFVVVVAPRDAGERVKRSRIREHTPESVARDDDERGRRRGGHDFVRPCEAHATHVQRSSKELDATHGLRWMVRQDSLLKRDGHRTQDPGPRIAIHCACSCPRSPSCAKDRTATNDGPPSAPSRTSAAIEEEEAAEQYDDGDDGGS